MNTRILFICFLLMALGLPACSKHTDGVSTGASHKILYHCAMHPQIISDKPGECPICHMNLIPIENGSSATAAPASAPGRATVHMSADTEQRIGVTVATVEERVLSTLIHASAQVAYDPQLYSALLEHQEAVAFLEKMRQGQSPEILEEAQATVHSSELRLRQMGLSESQIDVMTRPGRDLSSLILGSDGGSVWVYASVYDYEAPLIHPGQNVELSSKALPGESYRGTVEAIDSILNNDTRTLRVRLRVPDPQRHLKPEMYLDATLHVALGKKLAVPSSAVVDTGERQLAYVQTEPGTYEARDIELGPQAEGYVEVVSGLKEGDKVATSANFLIDSESRIQAATQEATEQMK